MIETNHLTKRFQANDQEVLAVANLSFTVNPGEVYGLLGPNGAGKTTTLRLILGLLDPTSGNAVVDGFDVTTSPDEVKQRIGYAAASIGVYPWLTAREMLAFVGDLYELEPVVTNQRIAELSQMFEFQDLLDRRCATLSTGQKQRVNLARALIHDPPAMLLDEPTTGLDVIGSKTIFDYVGHLKSQNKAVIVSTHRLDEAERLCDRCGLLYQGRLCREGAVDHLLQDSGTESLTDLFLHLLETEHPPLGTDAHGGIGH